ncbi:hypothetical protein [Bradyrhizobium macuxiense]|nr:hypothetical protein [Bradyrhizobium macuxiense]
MADTDVCPCDLKLLEDSRSPGSSEDTNEIMHITIHPDEQA